MIHRLLNLSLIFMLVIVFSSCGETLGNDEISIIKDDLAKTLYEENLWYQAQNLDDYLYEAVDAYADNGHDEMQAEIDSYDASSTLFGGVWNVAELFGTSAPELYKRTYYRYVGVANDNRGNMANVMKKNIAIIAEIPEILDMFENGETFSLKPFKNIEDLTESVSVRELQNYKILSLSKSYKVKWGEMVMGTLKNPRFSPTAVVCAMLNAFYPEAEYALYDEEEEGWKIGYRLFCYIRTKK